MKTFKSLLLLPAVSLLALNACNDEVSPVGSQLSQGEVTISIESSTLDLSGQSYFESEFDARGNSTLIGRISLPEYGHLNCAYLTRLLPVPALGIADNLTDQCVDSMKLFLNVPRSRFIGDTLAPQQVRVYRLTRQIPDGLTNEFDPDGYFDPSAPLGSGSYTLSQISRPAKAALKDSIVKIELRLSLQFAREVFNRYRTDPETFQWPSTLAKWLPGLYVENTFGSGCITNVVQTSTRMYYHYETEKTTVDSEGESKTETVTVRDSVAHFTTSDAVLSANLINFRPAPALAALAAEKTVVTTPGGYVAKVAIPIEQLLSSYKSATHALSVISDLTMKLPATPVESSPALSVPPYLLLIRESEKADFFANQMLPDGRNAFYAKYDEKTGAYKFSGMRKYISDLAAMTEIPDNEIRFVIVPVAMKFEESTNAYGQSTGTVNTSCTPYMATPTAAVLDTSKAEFEFTFSQQTLK